MSSIVSETTIVGDDTTIGHFAVIGENVRIGSGCQIGHHVVIHDDTILGDNCVIDDHAVVGKRPLRSRPMAIQPGDDLDPLVLAEGVVIGTGAIVFRGSQIGEDSLVADLASVREQSIIGTRSIVGRGVAVENRVLIGDRVKIEAGAFVCAFTEIADDCFVAPEVALTNDNYLGRTEERKKNYKGTTIERGGRVGANATVLPGKTIHSDGVAAAGATVTKDIPAGEIRSGIQATRLKDVPPEQRLP